MTENDELVRLWKEEIAVYKDVSKVTGLSLWYYSLRSNTKGYGGKTH
jgi:hypothetical protein